MISARFLESRSRGDVQSRWLWSHAGKMFIVHKHKTKQYEQANKPANHQFFFLTLFRSGKIIHSWIQNASRSQTTKNVYTHTRFDNQFQVETHTDFDHKRKYVEMSLKSFEQV